MLQRRAPREQGQIICVPFVPFFFGLRIVILGCPMPSQGIAQNMHACVTRSISGVLAVFPPAARQDCMSTLCLVASSFSCSSLCLYSRFYSPSHLLLLPILLGALLRPS